MTGRRPDIVAFGDVMLQWEHPDPLPASDQRTAIIDWSRAELGGAVWNIAWYLRVFGRAVRIAGQYGADAAGYLAARADAAGLLHGALVKAGPTDRLLMFKRGGLPSLYFTEPLAGHEIDLVCAMLPAADIVIFAGTRHANLRARYLDTVAGLRPKLVVFAPSYTAYDYTAGELERFLRGADLTFVNAHEAAHLCAVLGESNPGAVMRRSRLGGVVTRAAAGVRLYPDGDGEMVLASTSGVAGNVVGAGEAFLCGFIEGFLQTGDFLAAGRLGTAVAAQTAQAGRICAAIDPMRAKAEAGVT